MTETSEATKPKSKGPAWVPAARNYSATKTALPTVDTLTHPLLPKPSAVVVPAAAATATTVKEQTKLEPQQQLLLDPLSMMGNPLMSIDPLSPSPSSASPQQQQQQGFSTSKQQEYDESKDESFIPWAAVKSSILQEYSTDQRIGITVSFMNASKTPTAASVTKDKAAQRLEELEQTMGEESSGEKQTLSLTQKEYVKHLEGMHADMVAAWEKEDRVKTLKVVIQAAKLLSDVSVPAVFYPSKFVLVTEIMDTFGNMVYDRIKKRRTVIDPVTRKPLPDKDVPQSVIDFSKETCKNWFYKIASIRELMPRLYTEMAILKCHLLLDADKKTLKDMVEELCWQLRGIGDPLVQAYAMCYLSRRAHEVIPLEKGFLFKCLHDTLATQNALGPVKFERIRQIVGLPSPIDYMRLYSPSYEWLMRCLAHKATLSTLDATLQEYSHGKNALVLNHIFSSFPPEFISSSAIRLTQLIKDADVSLFPQHTLYRTLGIILALVPPQFGQELLILNDVWKVVCKLDDLDQYMSVAEVWIEYTLNHCKPREVNILLRDVLAHVSSKPAPGAASAPTTAAADDKTQALLLSILSKVFSRYDNFNTIFGMDALPKVLDLLAPASVPACSKFMLEAFARSKETTTDPVVINTLFSFATTLHDSINTLSLGDEVRQVGRLVCQFVAKINYGMEVEKQLNFYSDCRKCFANLDSVRHQLVLSVAALIMKTLAVVKGKHTKKTSAFVRACISNCFVTIPAMEDVFARLNLYLLVGEIALTNGCVTQADSFFRSAITLIQEVPLSVGTDKQTEEQLAGFLANFLSAVIIVPGHPDLGPFYLFQALLKVLQGYPWSRGSLFKGVCLCKILSSLAALAQPELLYHAGSVEANDSLYRGDPDYHQDLRKLAAEVAMMLTAYLEDELKQEPDTVYQQARLALDVFNTVLGGYATNAHTATLAYTAFNHARDTIGTHGLLSPYLNSSLEWIKNRTTRLDQELYKKLSADHTDN